MSIKHLRSEIRKQINFWFGSNLEIDERLLQILEYSPNCSWGWMDSADVFSATIEFLPSLADLFIRAGITTQHIENLSDELRRLKSIRVGIDYWSDIYNHLYIEQTLFLAFPDIQDDIRSNSSARILKKGSITAVDLITSIIEAEIDDDQIGNELTANILRLNGFDATFWDDDSSKFISDLVEKIRFLETLDKSLGEQQFVLYWDGSHYRFRPFGTTGIYQFSAEPLKDSSLWIARGNVIQPIQRFQDEAFDELEYLINNNVTEKVFQDFFENHPEFLLALGGGKYIDIHPQIILHEDNGGRLIPDFLLEKVNDHFCDICDLKLATQTIKKSKLHRPGFKAAIHEAIAQLEFYRNWFEDKQHRDAFYNKTGLNAYRPRVVLIVGRMLDYYSDIERIQRESLFPNHVELVTYDEVLLRAKTYRSIVSS